MFKILCIKNCKKKVKTSYIIFTEHIYLIFKFCDIKIDKICFQLNLMLNRIFELTNYMFDYRYKINRLFKYIYIK